MSKLPHAPLIEVVIELKWQITQKNELTGIQYLYGDLYNELKDKYPYRENIIPVDIPIEMILNQPVHRFRAKEGGYPLIQIGPGILTLNTIDDIYEWNSFFEDAKKVIEKFLKVYPLPDKQVVPGIMYIDFFSFNFGENDVLDYINRNFKVTLSQSFFEVHKPPIDFNMGFTYNIDLGQLHVNFRKGIANKSEGILLQTRINGKSMPAKEEKLSIWLNNAHELTSDLFKQLTAGELYESFK
jgi:uncharacterized protein (TIGR04255 family)